MGGMPLAAIITIAIIAGVIVLIVAVTFALRARRHKRLSQQLVKRNDDQVHYVFVVNPSKPQAAQRRAHIEQFCRDKGLTDVEFIDTQLDKDGRACAKEALANGADVVVAVGGDGTVRTVASAMSGTGHAMGIIPIGTGNLFARNMVFRSTTSTRRSPSPHRTGRGTWTSAVSRCWTIRRPITATHS